MIPQDQSDQLIGMTAYDTTGDKVGSIEQIFLDDQTGRPEFATVKTGLFGTKENFVPLGDVSMEGDRVTLPHSKDKIKDAPQMDDSGGHLEPSQEDELYRYYGMSDLDQGTSRSDRGRPDMDRADMNQRDADQMPRTGRDDETRRPTDAGGALGTKDRDADQPRTGPARLRRHVVTEETTATSASGRNQIDLDADQQARAGRDRT